jgi:hypothetical protein
MEDGPMTERPSYRWENERLLITAIMNKLGITEDQLENEPSWTKAKIREFNIDTVLEN